MSKVFGYPEFDKSGEQVLVTYDNEYKAGESRSFGRNGEETAVLLLSGEIKFAWDNGEADVSRKDVFTEGPWCVHSSSGKQITVKASADSEILVQCTKNEAEFASRLYKPEDAPWKYSCKGKFGDVAKRRVNTIFDHDIAPYSNMVLGCYYFKFDRPEGFGASFVGDQVFKSVDGSFSAIPGGELHPQAVAPGFMMYTCWMIRHLEGNPWLQTDRCEDERYTWLHEAKF